MSLFTESTSILVRNREYERVWQRHCGFLDLTLTEFMEIQERLMEEQLALATQSNLWISVFGDVLEDLDIDSFRHLVPMTTYADYEPFLVGHPEDVLSRPIAAWARTSGRGGKPKWVPYTPEGYLYLGIAGLGAGVLSAARHRGDIQIRLNDIAVSNLPARPYLSGLMLEAANELFHYNHIPPLNDTDTLTFQERTAAAYQQAMIQGMDLLGAMTLVIVKMGEMFESGALRQNGEFSWSALHPKLIGRYIQATLKARREGRNFILPRDLWNLKGLQCGGTDTFLYREQVKEYWGVYPHESYGCTEAGILATQAWDHLDMTFYPSTAFFEFIPEEAWARERLEGVQPTKTLLMDQLEEGKRYEVVISSFYGGPFLRYRMHDLVEVTRLQNEELDIRLPQFRFVGRSGDFIDLSGFAGLIDEKQLLTALHSGGVIYEDWVITKEIESTEPYLHLYIEMKPDSRLSSDEIMHRFHHGLEDLNPEYANIQLMLGFVPVRVSQLSPGTFQRYIGEQVKRDADLSHLKPNRMQPPAEAVALLLAQSAKQTDV